MDLLCTKSATELAELITMIKKGSECEEGINSFLEKRKPNWVK